MRWNVSLLLILILAVQPGLGSASDCANDDPDGASAGHHQMVMDAGEHPTEGAGHHQHLQPEQHGDHGSAPDACCGADCSDDDAFVS